jgi:AAA domain, putative AbiEii toxin, Type IV TA system
LSQHFVEKLCSAKGLATELRSAIERVVFDNTTEKYETDSVDELADVLLDPIRRRRAELQEAIAETTEQIVREDSLIGQLLTMRRDRDALKKQVDGTQRALAALLPKGNELRVQRLTQLERAVLATQARVDALRRKEKTIQDLAAEARYISSTTEPRRLEEMRRRFAVAELTGTEWGAFGMKFTGDIQRITSEATAVIQRALKLSIEGEQTPSQDPPSTPMESWPLNIVTAQRDAAQKAVGIDRDRLKRYEDQRRIMTQQQTSLARFDEQIQLAEGAHARRQELLESRRGFYVQVCDEFVKEEEVLRRLYERLKQQLEGWEGALSKLGFVVQRRVDLEQWSNAGEDQLDLRNATRVRGRGSVQREAAKYLATAWRDGAAEAVSAAMEQFREELWDDIKGSMATVPSAERPQANRELAAWLYDTSHITIEYAIEYEGVRIENLSPGTRGIVLLLLYLAVDRQDVRPLIIDQPEENLDPNSVFKELVPHFREARERRQVIIVTHNANLVVNTDADQVVIAASARVENSTLPSIEYVTGALENEGIRRSVCKTLEGGDRAFLERDRRYRLRWGEDLLVDEGPVK